MYSNRECTYEDEVFVLLHQYGGATFACAKILELKVSRNTFGTSIRSVLAILNEGETYVGAIAPDEDEDVHEFYTIPWFQRKYAVQRTTLQMNTGTHTAYISYSLYARCRRRLIVYILRWHWRREPVPDLCVVNDIVIIAATPRIRAVLHRGRISVAGSRGQSD